APGLIEVVRALHAEGHHVNVAAPPGDRSGSGAGLGSIEHGLEVAYEQRELPGLAEVHAVSVDAPPAFAVLASCSGVFGARPDIVVSGINDGFNTGRFILTSSTVGAALAAGALGSRALALSAGFAPEGRIDTAARVTVEMVDWLISHSQPRTVLNMNVPDVDIEAVKGVRLGDLGPRGLMGLRLHKGDDALRLERFHNTEGIGHDSDASLVRDGYVAITALPSLSQTGHISEAIANPAEHVEGAL